MTKVQNQTVSISRFTDELIGIIRISFIVTGLFIFLLPAASIYAADKFDSSSKSGHAMHNMKGKHDMSKMGKMDMMKPAAKATDKVTPIAISDKARSALSPVYDTYFALQSALASDDFALAVKSYKQFDSSLSLVDMKLFEGKTHMKWMAFAGQIAEQANLGANSKDIKVARKTFEALSLSVIEMERTFGHTGDREFYLTFCPMALGTGAYWMQTDKNVRNSFYGSMMLKCGSVKETFTSTDGK